MPRLCDDCGIPPWQACVCVPTAANGLDPADNPYQRREQAQRPPITLTPAPQPTTPDFTPADPPTTDPF